MSKHKHRGALGWRETLAAAQGKHQAGLLREAEAEYRKILRSNPDNPETLSALGMLHYQSGRPESALDLLRGAVRQRPDYFEAHYNLANVCKQQGLGDEALEHFLTAIEIQPNFAAAHNNLGNLLRDHGDADGAERHFRRAIELDPGLVSAQLNLGNLLQDKGNPEAALAAFQAALAADPNSAMGHYHLAEALARSGDEQHAIEHFQRAIGSQGDFVQAYNGLGTLYYKKGDLAQAEHYCRLAEQHDPTYVDAGNNLGCVLSDQGRYDEAAACFRRVTGIQPDNVNAYYNLGNTEQARRNLDTAIKCYEKALELQPDHAGAHWEMALALLLAGDFPRGWTEYVWRLQRKEHAQRPFTQPVWQGGSLTGKTILIYGEQGVGDEITFASCFAEIIEQADRVIIECDPRLRSLLQRSFPAAISIGRPADGDITWTEQFAPIDFQVPAGSLPRFLRPDLRSFPVQNGYLVPDLTLRERWKQRLGVLGGGRKIGISWKGGAIARARKKRSTTLDQWAGVLAADGAHFINLQYGDCAEEIAKVFDDLGVMIHDWPDADPIKELDNFAAQISALDLVISVDNSTVHMAGALSIPTWILQPYVPEWRWLLNRTDSPWYASVRQFRQTSLGDWKGVFAAVSRSLHGRLTAGAGV